MPSGNIFKLINSSPIDSSNLEWQKLIRFCKDFKKDRSEEQFHGRMVAFLKELGPDYTISSKHQISDKGILDILIEKDGVPCAVIELKMRVDAADDRHQIFHYGLNLIRDNPSCEALPLILFDGLNFVLMVASMSSPDYFPYIHEPREKRIRSLGKFKGYIKHVLKSFNI